jgi:hypothetical protein
VAAAQQAHGEVLLGGRDPAQRRPELGAPAALEAAPVVGRDPQLPTDPLERVRIGGPLAFDEGSDGRRFLQPRVQLVPLDLVGDQGRDDVVDVGRAGHVHRQGVGAIVVPLAAPRRRLHRLPCLDVGAEGPGEMLGELPEHHPLDGARDGRQAVDRVDEGTRVRGGAGRAGMQARVDVAVRRLEGAQADLARTAQDRAVGAHVQLDLVAAGRRPLLPERRSDPIHVILGSIRRAHTDLPRPTIGCCGCRRSVARRRLAPRSWAGTDRKVGRRSTLNPATGGTSLERAPGGNRCLAPGDGSVRLHRVVMLFGVV